MKDLLYLEFMAEYRTFLKDHDFDGPSELHRAVSREFEKRKWPVQSLSQFWEPFYGRGTLTKIVLAHLNDRYKWTPPARCFIPTQLKNGGYLTGKFLKIAGQRELKLAD